MSQSNGNLNKYTTGEIAKLCGVTVRTVQYYDDRGILIPSELSEGGRRLYTEQDLKRMHIICFLREVGLHINSISALFAEKNPENIISVLLEQQEVILREELDERRQKLDMLENIKRELRDVENFSVDSIGDIAYIMKQKNNLSKMRLKMALSAVPVLIFQIVCIILSITSNLWWLWIAYLVLVIPWGIWLSKYYYDHIAYICPECHEVFKPRFKEMFWAYHTPKMRRLTCPKCGRRGMCVEVYDSRKENGK